MIVGYSLVPITSQHPGQVYSTKNELLLLNHDSDNKNVVNCHIHDTTHQWKRTALRFGIVD